MKVRKATQADFERIMEIYRFAQDLMIDAGNPDQWGHFYPDTDMVRNDIKEGISYVICETQGAGADGMQSASICETQGAGTDDVQGAGADESQCASVDETQGAAEDVVQGVFALMDGPDVTYAYIEDGAWLNDEPYVVIHRIASAEDAHGIMKCATDFCKSIAANVRIDTHHNNTIMQRQIEKNGFTKCGVIYVEDGSARIAYHWTRE